MEHYAAGVQLAEVSLLLGHSELRVTADLYTHLQKQTSAKAAQCMDAMLLEAFEMGSGSVWLTDSRGVAEYRSAASPVPSSIGR
jgi:hypothetical protein